MSYKNKEQRYKKMKSILGSSITRSTGKCLEMKNMIAEIKEENEECAEEILLRGQT